jgi:hypothetical protein
LDDLIATTNALRKMSETNYIPHSQYYFPKKKVDKLTKELQQQISKLESSY